MSYHSKYLKYKTKYLKLKVTQRYKQIGGKPFSSYIITPENFANATEYIQNIPNSLAIYKSDKMIGEIFNNEIIDANNLDRTEISLIGKYTKDSTLYTFYLVEKDGYIFINNDKFNDDQFKTKLIEFGIKCVVRYQNNIATCAQLIEQDVQQDVQQDITCTRPYFPGYSHNNPIESELHQTEMTRIEESKELLIPHTQLVLRKDNELQDLTNIIKDKLKYVFIINYGNYNNRERFETYLKNIMTPPISNKLHTCKKVLPFLSNNESLHGCECVNNMCTHDFTKQSVVPTCITENACGINIKNSDIIKKWDECDPTTFDDFDESYKNSNINDTHKKNIEESLDKYYEEICIDFIEQYLLISQKFIATYCGSIENLANKLSTTQTINKDFVSQKNNNLQKLQKIIEYIIKLMSLSPDINHEILLKYREHLYEELNMGQNFIHELILGYVALNYGVAMCEAIAAATVLILLNDTNFTYTFEHMGDMDINHSYILINRENIILKEKDHGINTQNWGNAVYTIDYWYHMTFSYEHVIFSIRKLNRRKTKPRYKSFKIYLSEFRHYDKLFVKNFIEVFCEPEIHPEDTDDIKDLKELILENNKKTLLNGYINYVRGQHSKILKQSKLND